MPVRLAGPRVIYTTLNNKRLATASERLIKLIDSLGTVDILHVYAPNTSNLSSLYQKLAQLGTLVCHHVVAGEEIDTDLLQSSGLSLMSLDIRSVNRINETERVAGLCSEYGVQLQLGIQLDVAEGPEIITGLMDSEILISIDPFMFTGSIPVRKLNKNAEVQVRETISRALRTNRFGTAPCLTRLVGENPSDRCPAGNLSIWTNGFTVRPCFICKDHGIKCEAKYWNHKVILEHSAATQVALERARGSNYHSICPLDPSNFTIME
jgi:hypothetical protein